MNLTLNPIKKLVISSMILHIAALFIAAIFVVFSQRPLWPFLTGNSFPEESTLFLPPFIIIAPIVLIFLLHCCLTMIFLKTIRCENNHLKQLRPLSILTLIAVPAVFPILYTVWGYLEHFLIARNTSAFDDFLINNALRTLISFGLIVRDISMSVLLIAAAMSWYHCFMQRTAHQEHLPHRE